MQFGRFGNSCPDDDLIIYTLESGNTIQLGVGGNMLVYNNGKGYTIDYYTNAYNIPEGRKARGYCYVIGDNDFANKICRAVTQQEGEVRNGRHWYYLPL